MQNPEVHNGFEIIDHYTCFSLKHVDSGKYVGPAFKTKELAIVEANKYLSWYYSVSFKEPRKTTLKWIDIATQDSMEAVKKAREHAAKRGIPGNLYGVSKIKRFWRIEA